MTIKTVDSKIVFTGKIFNIRSETVEMPNGNKAKFDILSHPGAVVIFPIDNNGNVWLIRQYRHAVGEKILELPAGTLEKDELPIDCANREIQEEIGMKASKMNSLGKFFSAPGFSDELMYLFIGEDLSESFLPQDEDEIIEVEKYPLSEIQKMIKLGEIVDAKTIAGVYMAINYLKANRIGN